MSGPIEGGRQNPDTYDDSRHEQGNASSGPYSEEFDSFTNAELMDVVEDAEPELFKKVREQL